MIVHGLCRGKEIISGVVETSCSKTAIHGYCAKYITDLVNLASC